jgi:hypothetical protein
MKLNNLNTWLSLTANVGVLLGIIFLAVEIQQNTNMMQAQTSESITDKQLNWYLETGTDPYSSDILVRGGAVKDLNSVLDPQEINSYFLLVNALFRIWENEIYQYKRGLYSEEEFLPRIESWRYQYNRNPGMSYVWEANQPAFSRALVELVESFSNEK